MKILIDILHPAHVHFFRNFIAEMKQRNHQLCITARQKDVTLELLREYGIEHIPISEIGKGKLNLGKELLTRNLKLIKICRQFRPDILLGVMGPSIATVGALLRIPRIVFYNNENAHATNWFVYPLANAVVTSSSYARKITGNHITYQGYHEYAYLHPRWFTPNLKTLAANGIDPKEKFILVRFVSWQASHDVGEKGLNDKVKLVQELEQFAKVYITSESNVPEELKKNVLLLQNKKDIFDIMSQAALIFGEGATMASEAALLGVPAVYVNSLQLGYLQEQERNYHLVYNFTNQEQGLQKAKELLQQKNLRKEHQQRLDTLRQEKIDVTQWMIDFVEKFSLPGTPKVDV